MSTKKVLLYMPVSRKLALILWVFVTLVIVLLILGYQAIETLSAARALWAERAFGPRHRRRLYSA